jgi:hypothetical protein
MRFQIPIVLVTNAALISAVPLATSPTSAPAGTIIGTIISGGTGCQSGSGTAVVEPGNSTFDLSTPDLITTSTDVPPRNVCQFNIPITYPSGYQYGIQEIDYSGHETVPSGSSGSAMGSIYFSGNSATTSFSTPFSSDTDVDFAASYVPAATDVVWSPCASGSSVQAALNVQTEVRVGRGSAVGSVSIDKSVVKLEWRTC